nr:hypothetical protein [uncultured archaeon]
MAEIQFLEQTDSGRLRHPSVKRVIPENVCENCGVPLSDDKHLCEKCEREENGGYDPR